MPWLLRSVLVSRPQRLQHHLLLQEVVELRRGSVQRRWTSAAAAASYRRRIDRRRIVVLAVRDSRRSVQSVGARLRHERSGLLLVVHLHGHRLGVQGVLRLTARAD